MNLDEIARLSDALGKINARAPDAREQFRSAMTALIGNLPDLLDLLRRGVESRLAFEKKDLTSPADECDWYESNPVREGDHRPGFWARVDEGLIASVRQCRQIRKDWTPAWTAAVNGEILMDDATQKPRYFNSCEDAKSAAVAAAWDTL